MGKFLDLQELDQLDFVGWFSRSRKGSSGSERSWRTHSVEVACVVSMEVPKNVVSIFKYFKSSMFLKEKPFGLTVFED